MSFAEGFEHLPNGVRSVLLMPFNTPVYRKAIRKLRIRGIQVICLSRSLAGVDCSCVVHDGFAGGHKATCQLLENWPGPVHFVGYPRASCPAVREDGWLAAMADHGFIKPEQYCKRIPTLDSDLWVKGYDLAINQGRAIGLDIFNIEPPNGHGWSIFCSSDLFALGVYRAAEERNLQIGKDVRIVGYGNYPFAKRLTPALSSVEVANGKIGYSAAELAFDFTRDHPLHSVRRILPVTLIERQSSSSKTLVEQVSQPQTDRRAEERKLSI